MVKTVYSSTKEVADVWAAQTHEKARTGSNTWCKGRQFGSYGTVVGLLEPGADDNLVAIMSEGGYSSGTAKVIGEATASAKAAGYRLFTVGRVIGPAHSRNLARYDERIAEALAKIENAMKPSDRRRDAKRLIAEAAAYAEAFGWTWAHNGPPVDSVLSRREREAKA